MIVLAMLVMMQDPAAEAARRLQDPDISVREQAQEELAWMGEAARPVLEQLLASDDAETVRRAQTALTIQRRLRRLPASLAKRRPELLDRDVPLAELLALDLTDEEASFFAGSAARDFTLPPAPWLRAVRGRASADDLARAVRGAPQLGTRVCALAALQEVDAPSALRLAREAVRSPRAELRLQACFTLAEAGTAGDAAFTVRLLRDPEPLVVRAAAIATRRLEPGADVPAAADPGRRLDLLLVFARTGPPPDASWLWIDPPSPQTPRSKK